MKKFILLALMAVMTLGASAKSKYTGLTGVWAAQNAEALLTDSVCLFFERVDANVIKATLQVPSRDFCQSIVFDSATKKATVQNNSQISIIPDFRSIIVNGQKMKRVEELTFTAPTSTKRAINKNFIADCLKQWRLGVTYTISGNNVNLEAATNRYEFSYKVDGNNASASAVSFAITNDGLVLAPSVRLSDVNGKFNASMSDDVAKAVRAEVTVDSSKFNAAKCDGNHDKMYWSVSSFEPSEIVLKTSCGKQQTVNRPTADSTREYIKFQK